MTPNQHFATSFSKFLSFARYVQDPDYHGKVMIAKQTGTIVPLRSDCDADNLKKIRRSISMLYKLGTSAAGSKINVYTTFQIRFVAQCLLDRLLAKYHHMTHIAWDQFPSSSKQIQLVLQLVRHEKILQDTFRTLSQAVKLRSKVTNTSYMLYILRILRKCILWKGFSTPIAKEQKRELLRRHAEIKREYTRLSRSTRWKQIIKAIDHSKINTYVQNLSLFELHRKRMNGLLEHATSIL